MKCARFVGTGITSTSDGEKSTSELIRAKCKRKLSMKQTFSKKSSKSSTPLHNEEDITLLDATRSKFDDIEKCAINDTNYQQHKSSTTVQLNGKFEKDKGKSNEFGDEKINQVMA